jgi:hypothetical protein
MKFITHAFEWIVYSSADAQSISLSVKGGLTLAATLLTIAAGMANIQLPSDLLTQLV